MDDKDEVRKSIRMKEKSSFTFKNTIDDAIDLDADDDDDAGDFTSRPSELLNGRLRLGLLPHFSIVDSLSLDNITIAIDYARKLSFAFGNWNLSTMKGIPRHAPWKNYRVINGHSGCVRSIAFDPSNQWFCTGSADRTIKIWDVASGKLRLTLTGHTEQVRGVAVSDRHTYMFSVGDDEQVKCWDLEQNKVIRSYHGHLSGVFCVAIHPTLDVLLTGGRDSLCRVWDIRTKMQICCLSGHWSTVSSVFTRSTAPQVVTGSHDSTIKFWDLRHGTPMTTLTHHIKSVRALAHHPTDNSFASASVDNIKKFGLPEGQFYQNMLSEQPKTIINAMAVNKEGVLATGGDNGSLQFWDWNSGYNFQQSQTIAQPGSLEGESGIYALSYDITGSRLITCESDKTIKFWKEDGKCST